MTQLGGPSRCGPRCGRDASSRPRLARSGSTPTSGSGSSFTTVLGGGSVVATVDAERSSPRGRWPRRRLRRCPPTSTARSGTTSASRSPGPPSTARVNDAGLGDVYAEARLVVPGLKVRSAPVSLAGLGRAGQPDRSGRWQRPSAGWPTYRRLGSCWQVTSSTAAGSAPAGSGCDRTPRQSLLTASCPGRCRTPTWSAPATTPGCSSTRRPPADSWIAETKLHLDLGEDDIRNYQQAGMIAYLQRRRLRPAG